MMMIWLRRFDVWWNHNLLGGKAREEPCSLNKQNMQQHPHTERNDRSRLGELGMQLAVSSAHPALKDCQTSTAVGFSTQDRKERGGEREPACVSERVGRALSPPFSIRNQHGDSKVIRHCSLSPPSKLPQTHACYSPFLPFFLFPIPHMSHCASCYIAYCVCVSCLFLFLENFTLFYWSVDRATNHTGNLHGLRSERQ